MLCSQCHEANAPNALNFFQAGPFQHTHSFWQGSLKRATACNYATTTACRLWNNSVAEIVSGLTAQATTPGSFPQGCSIFRDTREALKSSIASCLLPPPPSPALLPVQAQRVIVGMLHTQLQNGSYFGLWGLEKLLLHVMILSQIGPP